MNIRHVDTINAVDDLGNRHLLGVWEELIEVTTSQGTNYAPGVRHVYDQNGHHINVLNNDEFLVVETNTKLKRNEG